jgi:predicted dehydrogenase
MGRYHANIYAALPDTELVAVVDPDPARRREAERSYGCDAYASLDELLGRHRLDAASVAAPTSLHYPLTRDLLLAGVHVLVEKPVATDVAQAHRLAELSRRLDLVLQVGHITRFYRAVDLLRDRVRDPYLIEARRTVPHARVSDVGVILDLMIHDIDIVLGLVSAEIDEVSVAGRTLGDGAFEDVATAQVTFSNGCIARFLASRVAHDGERSLVIAEAGQTLHLDFAREPHTEIAIFRPQRGAADGSHVQVDRHAVHEGNPLRKELEHFLERICRRTEPIGTLDQDIRALELATRFLDQLAHKRSRLLV